MSKYYTSPPDVIDGDVAYARDVNDVNAEANTGFTLVEADITAIPVDVAAYAEIARKWAEEVEDTPVEPGQFSSLHWASKSDASATAAAASAAAALASQVAAALSETASGLSEVAAGLSETNAAASEVLAGKWAEEAEDVEVEPGEYSAHHWATKASAFAGSILDTIYGVAWNGDTTHAASRNTIYDKIESLDKTDVGLDNVDNTSDANKPVSTATQSALDNKQEILEPPTGVLVTGNIQGLEYGMNVASPTDTIDITAGACMDSLNTTELTLSSATTAQISSPVLNTIYNVFVCDTGGTVDVQFDTDVDGATLLAGTVDYLRWVGFVRTDPSGDICIFSMRDDSMSFGKASENFITTAVSGTYATLDHSGMIPISRIEAIHYGVYRNSATSRFILRSLDGTNTENYLGLGNTTSSTDTGSSAWGDQEYQTPGMIPFYSDALFIASSTITGLLCHAVKLRR